MKNETELNLPPKHISQVLKEAYGVSRNADYIRKIRKESARRADGLFVLGVSKPRMVYEWLQANPSFRYKSKPNVI